MKHLNESILSKRTGLYSDKWKTKEQIIEFLKSNGYEEIEAQSDMDLRRYGDYCGKPVFSMGLYNNESSSHWIKFYDGSKLKGIVMFCREMEIMDQIHGATAMYSRISYGAWKEFDNFKEFREYVRNNLEI